MSRFLIEDTAIHTVLASTGSGASQSAQLVLLTAAAGVACGKNSDIMKQLPGYRLHVVLGNTRRR